MRATRQRLVPLNARVSRPLRQQFDVAVARRRITKQKAVEEALRLWLHRPSNGDKRRMIAAPLIKSNRPGTVHLTNEQIDAILFG
jgi:hypothetical protein